jgi:hypothetical protein
LFKTIKYTLCTHLNKNREARNFPVLSPVLSYREFFS